MEIRALIELSRPVNIIVASLAVILTAFMTKEMNFKIAYAILSVCFITAGGNAINDYYDYDIDNINKPKRPLPSGRITRSEAKWISIATFCIGCIVAFFINTPCFIIAVIASILLYVYARDLKNSGFPGNITIAGLTGMAILYAGLSVSSIDRILYIAAFAFLINMGREIIKDAEDIEGDKAMGAKTLAIKYGIGKALKLSLIPLFLVILITPIPFFTGLYNTYYMAIIIIGIDLPIVYMASRIFVAPTTETAEKSKTLLKIMILIGIVALYLGL